MYDAAALSVQPKAQIEAADQDAVRAIVATLSHTDVRLSHLSVPLSRPLARACCVRCVGGPVVRHVLSLGAGAALQSHE